MQKQNPSPPNRLVKVVSLWKVLFSFLQIRAFPLKDVLESLWTRYLVCAFLCFLSDTKNLPASFLTDFV